MCDIFDYPFCYARARGPALQKGRRSGSLADRAIYNIQRYPFLFKTIRRYMDIARSGNPLAAVAALPAFLVPLIHAKNEDFTFVLVVCLSFVTLLVMQIHKYVSYLRKTPLVRIDETSMIFFGTAQSQQRKFQRDTISSIKLSERPHFWRSAFRLSIVVDKKTFDLWIPHCSRGSVSVLTRLLREQFPEEFDKAFA